MCLSNWINFRFTVKKIKMAVEVANGVAESIVHSNGDLKSLNPSHTTIERE